MDFAKSLKKLLSNITKADQLSEQSHMSGMELYWILKRKEDTTLTADGRKALERLDKALERLSDSREALGDAAYNVEQVVKLGRF